LTIEKREMMNYESTGNKTKTLQRLYDALKGIPSASVEAERIFSSAGHLKIKLRSRLSASTLDTWCF